MTILRSNSKRQLHRGGELVVRLGLRDADARSEVGRLDEHRIAQLARDARGDAAGAALHSRAATEVGHDRQPVRGEQRLHHRLVHADGRAEHAGADVGHVGELQQPLHGAVLAVRAVEHREDHVDAEPLTAAVGSTGSSASVGACFMHVRGGERRRRLAGQRPASVLVDADRNRLVAAAVEMLEDRRGRGDRHFVLAGPAAVDHADAKFLRHNEGSTYRGARRSRRRRQMTPRCRLHSVSRCTAPTAPPGSASSRRRTASCRRRRSCPSAPRARVKATLHRDLEELGAEIILGNTYHLFLRPGDELIARRGGLHRFIGWDRPHPDRQRRLSRSSAWPSAGASREEGAEFQSHLDGSRHC